MVTREDMDIHETLEPLPKAWSLTVQEWGDQHVTLMSYVSWKEISQSDSQHGMTCGGLNGCERW